MDKDAVLLVAEDDDGHFALIHKNLRRSGLKNQIIRFTDGQQVLDYFKTKEKAAQHACILLLDLRLPKISGLEVLEYLKTKPEFKRIPIIVLTTANAQQDVEQCHALGCALYIIKPIEYDAFVEAIQRIGTFLDIIEVPGTVVTT
jgi:CheY-like chemotaxis protein